MARFVAVTDDKGLKRAGVPFSKGYLYNLRSSGRYLGLVVRIGGRLVVDLDELAAMARRDREGQIQKFSR